jgi:hypothetical protein
MRKKVMLWLGLGAGILVIGGFSIFFYLISQMNAETRAKNTEFNELLEYAKSNGSLEKIAAHAAKTRFNEITFYRLGSSEALAAPPKTIESSTLHELANPLRASAQDSESVKNFTRDLKKGKAEFSDPKDNPLMYSRPHLRVEFDGDSIVKVEDGNLG